MKLQNSSVFEAACLIIRFVIVNPNKDRITWSAVETTAQRVMRSARRAGLMFVRVVGYHAGTAAYRGGHLGLHILFYATRLFASWAINYGTCPDHTGRRRLRTRQKQNCRFVVRIAPPGVLNCYNIVLLHMYITFTEYILHYTRSMLDAIFITS